MSNIEEYSEIYTFGRHPQSVISLSSDDFLHMSSLNTSLILMYFNVKTVSFKWLNSSMHYYIDLMCMRASQQYKSKVHMDLVWSYKTLV